MNRSRIFFVAGVVALALSFVSRAHAQSNIPCTAQQGAAYCLSKLIEQNAGVADSPVCWANTDCVGGFCNNFIADRCYGSTMCCNPQNSSCTPYNAGGCNGGGGGQQTCTSPYLNCHGSDWSFGCDTDPRTDINHCGSCNNRCSNIGGTPSCSNGSCTITCVSGFANCDNNVSNGCEVNTTIDDNNCGGCGQVCTPGAFVAATVCSGGACAISICQSGHADCDSNATNGCETNTDSNVSACGTCGHACPVYANASATCTSGTCGVACLAGYGNCDGNAANGCETAIDGDVNNCGTCGHVCPVNANQSAFCIAGTCGLACLAGYGNCDHNAANGCETNIESNANNCGACGHVCPVFANESATCTSGTCGVACLAGYSNCDGNAPNGCETNTNSDVNNCGACGHVCPNGTGSQRAVCNAGTCGLTNCMPGYETCGSSAACAVNTTTDINNCGGCSMSCSSSNITRACAGSVCVGTCLPGFADCDGNKLSNGCEVNFESDINNCGACGSACTPQHAIALCSSGKCGYSQCAAGYADCDGNEANGCETQGSCADMTTVVQAPSDMSVGVEHAGDMSVSGEHAGDMSSASTPPHHSGCSMIAGQSSSTTPLLLVGLVFVGTLVRVRRRRS
jgi:hypothetical protein